MSNLTEFWSNEGGWPVEKPGYVFLARAMKQIGQAMFPGVWTGSEPWADPVPRALGETPSLASKLEATEEMRRAYTLVGKPIPPPTEFSHLPPFETPSQPPRKLPKGIKSLPHVKAGPLPPLSEEEWALARARSLETVETAKAAFERWQAVQRVTWRAFLSGDLGCYLRNDQTGKYEGPTEPDWWNYEGYDSRFGLCRLETTRPLQQRHFERGRDIRSRELSGTDFRLIFVQADKLSALIESKSSPAPTFKLSPGEPTRITLDRSAEVADWQTAALWLGNGSRDGDAPPGAFEDGSAELIKGLLQGRYVAHGKCLLDISDVEYGVSRPLPSRLWQEAELRDEGTPAVLHPRVILRLDPPDPVTHKPETGTYRVALYLPGRSVPSWDDLRVETSGLIGEVQASVALVPTAEIPEPVAEVAVKPARISKEVRAVMAYLPHDKHWAEITNLALAERVVNWVTSNPERNREYPIGALDEATIRRFKKNVAEGRIILPKTAE